MKAIVLLVAAVLPASAQPIITESTPDIRTGIYNGKRVTFEVVDGLAVVEGDIILGTAEDLKLPESGQQVIEKPKDYQPKALVIADDFSERLWPEGAIPYAIDDSLPNPQRVLDAIEHWNDNTVIRLVERTREKDWVNFVKHEDRCASWIGKKGGEQEITVPERCGTGGIIHEIGHAAGLYHEQSREDRDSHVEVLFDNIDKRYIFASNQRIRTADDIGPYDYGSIMHYSAFGFSRNYQPTIETIPPGIPIGQREGLSPGDIDGIAEMYGEPPLTTTISTNPEGLRVKVDGRTIRTPKSFDWPEGTRHTISVPESQGDNEERFLFVKWSDGGEREHDIEASSETRVFTAHMIQQFKLQSGAQPSEGGEVILVPASPDGFYTNRSYVVVNAVPGNGYSFAWWQGRVWAGLHGYSGNPLEVPVRVDGLNYTALFTRRPLTTISTNAPGRRAVIDGKEWWLPMNFLWDASSIHSIGVTDVVQSGPSRASRWVFRDWSDGGGMTHTIRVPDQPSTFTAYFGEQHLLTKEILLSEERGSIYA
ncbi:MAG: M12 family metallopeptidase, partial [Acidobacteriota bacterium]|nr:M12 family metallopeptidase [Acidobacteriota bacterium]